MKDGLRRSNIRVKNLDVSGQVTGNIANPTMVSGEGDVWYVDASKATGASGDGSTWLEAFITIQEGVTAASAGDVVYVAAQDHTDYDTDPISYAETVIIPYATSNLALIGVSRGRTQGGLPQMKIGAGAVAMITVRAPGCLIQNIGINGYGSTGGGILLDGDNSTKAAFGTSIVNCHLKNCVVTTKVANSGGAIYGGSTQTPWQVLISGCRFYKNEVDIAVVGTSTVPQDWVIEDCVMSGPAANTNCNMWLTGGGSGINGVRINNCHFAGLPALTFGDSTRYINAIGCVGVLSNCTFGCATQGAGLLTFKAAGTGAFIPATVFLSGNYGETDTEGDTGYVYRAA